MFYIVKIILLLIFSPLIFILGFIMFGILFLKNKKIKLGIFSFLLGTVLYLFSCDFFISKPIIYLEKQNINLEYKIEDMDSYILLCGGIRSNTLMGIISGQEAVERIITVAKLYNKNPKPIYITGGKVLEKAVSESSVYKKELIDLGIPEKDIILEEDSRNTKENAIYTKKLMKKNEHKRGILVTSAIHMKRSMEVFKDDEIIFYPFPCNFYGITKNRGIQSYIPNYLNLKNFNSTLWEYFGIIYYRLRYKGE